MLAILRVRFKCYVNVCYRRFFRRNISDQKQKFQYRPSHASLVKKLSIAIERRLLSPRAFICLSDIFSLFHSVYLIAEVFACNWNQAMFRMFCGGKHFWSHLCWHLVIGCSLISGCPSIIPDALVGVVYSPNFPWNYPSYWSCVWRIRAPWGQRVKLTFIKFHLETSSSCAYDYVKVQDGYYTQLGKYCGFQIPSSSLTVEFHSDSSDTFSGFLALYQTGYSFPTRAPVWPTYRPWTTYRPYYPTTASALQHSCSSYNSEISKFTNFL